MSQAPFLKIQKQSPQWLTQLTF